MNTLQARLTAYMEAEGINPAELARRLSVERSTVTRYLKGQRQPSYTVYMRIEALLTK